MQVTLKQSEITAAIAAYLTNVLGVANVSPDTLSVTYKQGRSDKNGMTAELDIEAPAYEAKKAFVPACSDSKAALPADPAVTLGNELPSGQTLSALTCASAVAAPEVAPVVAAVEPSPVLTEALETLASTTPVYEGERRAEPRDEVTPVADRVVELNDEVAQALAEDAAADAAEPAIEEEQQAATAAPLFG